ncbi:MAG TPA: flavodoxin, partial [Rhodospirillaceae bacterium]|nr:flavodoxin [Rhodospirillaceae bacterium]
MKRLLIVGHAPSPNTKRLRDAVVAGAQDAEAEAVEIVVKAPLEAGPQDVLA